MKIEWLLKVEKWRLGCLIAMFRSKKLVFLEGSSKDHFRLPQLFNVCFKSDQVLSLFVVEGSQIPKTSSM